jgi:hypothetical protein
MDVILDAGSDGRPPAWPSSGQKPSTDDPWLRKLVEDAGEKPPANTR